MRTEEIEMRRRHSRRVSAIDMDKEVGWILVIVAIGNLLGPILALLCSRH